MDVWQEIIDISYYIDIELPNEIALAGAEAFLEFVDWVSGWFD